MPPYDRREIYYRGPLERELTDPIAKKIREQERARPKPSLWSRIIRWFSPSKPRRNNQRPPVRNPRKR